MKIRPIVQSDFSSWLPLWEGYNHFYQRKISQEQTQLTFARFLDQKIPMHAQVAEDQGKLVGFVHYLFHLNTATVNDVCYLQDLFTHDGWRGKGVGRSLIDAVYAEAKKKDSPRVYWLTHETNDVAKKLYDKVADYSGFVVYRKILS